MVNNNVTMRLILLLGTLVYLSGVKASQNYVSVGCYRDKIQDRALPDLIANFRVSHPIIDWANVTKTVHHCAGVAQSKGYVYFAVQFWGECWASHSGSKTYDKHGVSSDCYKGVGQGYTNYVYRNTGLENECDGYTGLSSPDRAMTYQNLPKSGYKCDEMKEGWYRFQGGAGNAMANSCVDQNRCATLVPGWLKDTLPSPNQGIVSGKVCYQYLGTCCQWNESIQVRNCGRFYVYKLKKSVYGCPIRYCGNGKQ